MGSNTPLKFLDMVAVRSTEPRSVVSEAAVTTPKKPKASASMRSTHVMAAGAVFFITFLAFCSMSFGQGLFQYYDQVLHDVHRKELQNALGFSLTPAAHGGSLRPEKLEAVRKSIDVMFASLPKNQVGRISVDVMQYMVHRYFSHKYNWIVTGFEPHHSNIYNKSNAHDLHRELDEYYEKVLKGSLAATGFSIDDAATVVGGVEQLIFDRAVACTESAYQINRFQVTDKLSNSDMRQVIYSYLIEGLMEGNYSDAAMHAWNKKHMDEIYPHWHPTQLWVETMVDADVGEKQLTSSPYMRGNSKHMYSFEETARLTTRISQELGPWANEECKVMKGALSNLDSHGTGRVKLSDFWGVKENEESSAWMFSESAAYLKALGVLDESDAALGAQVIIPNYVTSMSNCLWTNPHYSVCCSNDCENMMATLEGRLQAPMATTTEIMEAVKYLPSLSTFPTPEHEKVLNGTLRTRLEEIAAQNEGGMVPIHGRLFAQWLHYAFPRDCPYPHETGLVTPMTPGQWIEKAGPMVNEQGEPWDPTVVMDSHLEEVSKRPESLLPPSPHAGAKMWAAKEKLLTSSTASDEWISKFLHSLAGMVLVTALLVGILNSIRRLRHLRQGKQASGKTVAGSLEMPVAEQSETK